MSWGSSGRLVALGKMGIVPVLLQTPIVGFVTAAGVYWLLARIGWERPSVPLVIEVASTPGVVITGSEASPQAVPSHEPTGSEPPIS